MLVDPSTTETAGDAYAFSLVYSGSFSVDVEHFSPGYTRVLLGLHPLQLSLPILVGDTFEAPECLAVFSPHGLGGASRLLHRLMRRHLIASAHASQPRPVLLNHWEATYANFDSDILTEIAIAASKRKIKMFVIDDGWFGDKFPRTSDHAGLGDWTANPSRFPEGLPAFAHKIYTLGMRVGIWVEPEMVNRSSELYVKHPEWIMAAPGHCPSEVRNQMVLDLGIIDVQDYIVTSVATLLQDSGINYVKWDLNRAIHETARPAANYRYMLGLYRVLRILAGRFPDILWEGCASGGGRYDAGILHYMPQIWTSDNTDAVDRLSIQSGFSLAYPPSTMACHVSTVPNRGLGG